MKKILLVVFIFLFSFSVHAADGELQLDSYAYASISFTANLHSIFGFSSSPVNTAVQPDEMEAQIYFKYIDNSILQTDPFYVYYQIFSPDPVKILLHVEPGTNTPDSITWSDIGGELESFKSSNNSTNPVVIWEDADTIYTSPRIGSRMVLLNVDDFTGFNWNEEYDWKMVMTIQGV